MKHLSMVLSCVAAAVIGLSGCGGGNAASTQSVAVQVPSDYATRSSGSYDENVHGLVSATTVARWVTDWESSKPEGKGKLFIMQMGQITDDAAVGMDYLKADNVNVFVYDRTSGCTSTGDSRHDGVSSVPKPVFSGEQMDAAFEAYGIDAANDMFLLVTAEPTGEYVAGAARMWYTLTYWGIPQENIAMLDGQASYVLDPETNTEIAALGLGDADLFGAATSEMRNTAIMSVRDLPADGTVLQATMGEMMQLVATGDTTAVILDARSAAEYNGDIASKQSKTEFAECGADHNLTCHAAFEGHIVGAQNLYYTDVLNTADGSYTFKPLSEVEELFAQKGYGEGKTVYTYCRTGTKASLLTFTSAAVLGYPTRFYDGSWIQWGKLTSTEDTYGELIMPVTSAWRTDTYSVVGAYNAAHFGNSLDVSPVSGLTLDAADTNAIIEEDKAYKQ